ncbi:cbb3-type cytochrome oxidase assembly protein CcoS [Permianibacter sp. IMCC34836]|uniref:cbb3-type cytochrome oxidase assembly protein CcoS n=1 Tax=Permianibacter fluminis TaxID=2738515 RepID=UPI001551DD9B|nr:cbb3-type cytochrome oxidase assembly protein CcoS [Permianibacter fluminis]NQD37907.1 cbb3-type cytochrome oxidase assembly protein CcoS [Permianibacter fluminis]
MSAIYLLIPLAMLVLAVSIWLFFWAVKRGQFDDLDSPAHAILLDDDKPVGKPASVRESSPRD